MYLRCSPVLDSDATPCHIRAIIGFCGFPHLKAFPRTDGTTLQVQRCFSVREQERRRTGGAITYVATPRVLSLFFYQLPPGLGEGVSFLPPPPSSIPAAPAHSRRRRLRPGISGRPYRPPPSFARPCLQAK